MYLPLLTKSDATSTTAGATVTAGNSPFLPGEEALASIRFSNAIAGVAGVVKIQSSPDGTTWTDAFVGVAGLQPDVFATVVCDKYMRSTVTTAYTAGTVSVGLIGIT
jgi:hypothetical protein